MAKMTGPIVVEYNHPDPKKTLVIQHLTVLSGERRVFSDLPVSMSHLNKIAYVRCYKAKGNVEEILRHKQNHNLPQQPSRLPQHEAQYVGPKAVFHNMHGKWVRGEWKPVTKAAAKGYTGHSDFKVRKT